MSGVHRRRWLGGVQLIMAVRIEASRIDTRAQLEYTAQGGPHQHGTGRREERSAADVGGLCVSVHGGVLRTRRLHALTSSGRRVEQAVSQTQESGLRMLAASECRHVSRARMQSATLA